MSAMTESVVASVALAMEVLIEITKSTEGMVV